MHRIHTWRGRILVFRLGYTAVIMAFVAAGCAPSLPTQTGSNPQIAQTILAAVRTTQTAAIEQLSSPTFIATTVPTTSTPGNSTPEAGNSQPAIVTEAVTSDPCADEGCVTLEPTTAQTPLPGLTPLPTKSAQTIPLADIRISHPGQLSKVTSPISLEASVIPGADNSVHVELIGEDGSVLDRQVLGFATPHGQRVGINPKIEFEIAGVSETARLQVYVTDAGKRVTSLSSLELVLLSQGSAEINTVPDVFSPYVVLSPKPNQQVSGGVINISGLIRPINTQPLVIDLVADDGDVMGSRQVQASAGSQGEHIAFQTSLPYTAHQATWARLVLHQTDTRIQGDAAIFSQPVYVNP